MKTNFRTSYLLVILALVCGLVSCNRTNTNKFSKIYSLTEMDSVQLLNCLYSDHLIKDKFLIPDVKVDSIINGDILEVVESMDVMQHKIKYKKTYFILDDLEFGPYDSLLKHELTFDSTAFDFETLKLQPDDVYNGGLPVTNFFQPENAEARYYNKNGKSYLVLRGNLGCHGWYCNGYYFLFFDLNNSKPELFMIDFSGAYPFTFQNIGIKPTSDNKWLIYQPLVNYDAEPIIGVSIQPLKLINGKAIPDTLEQPSVLRYSYKAWNENPKIKALTICK